MSLALTLIDYQNIGVYTLTHDPAVWATIVLTLTLPIARGFYKIFKDAMAAQSSMASDYRQQFVDCRDHVKELEIKLEKTEVELEKTEEELSKARAQFITTLAEHSEKYTIVKRTKTDEQEN